MTLALDPAHEDLLARLAPHGRRLLARAADEALRLHAVEVGVEHLLAATLQDEDCGAHALVLHAFADPETIRSEVLALAPGVLVVASEATLPFSPRALAALLAAREREEGEVGARAVLEAALGALEPASRARLAAAGLASDAAPTPLADPAGRAARGAPLFERFSSEAKQALSRANRTAAEARLAAIAPAQLVVGCLRAVEALVEASGLPWQRARILLAAESVDETPLEDRALAPTSELATFLAGLPRQAGSVAFLGGLLSGQAPELAQLLLRHKISPALVERGRAAFPDPAD